MQSFALSDWVKREREYVKERQRMSVGGRGEYRHAYCNYMVGTTIDVLVIVIVVASAISVLAHSQYYCTIYRPTVL